MKKRKKKAAKPCPGMMRDGRCSPGAWLCRLCKRWHYLKRSPVRRGNLSDKRNGSPDFRRWDRL